MGLFLKETCKFLQQYGYLSADANPRSFKDIELTSAIAKFQRFDANVGIAKEATGEPLLPDGKIGPATLYAMQMPRCACPDVGETAAALGSGGWRGCHGLSDGHKAIARVNESNLPGFLKPSLTAVLRNAQKSYADLGLLFVFIDTDGKDMLTGERVTGTVNTEMSFTRGSGWIGLAIVGNGSNQRCSSSIWAKFDYRYQPSNVTREWTTLIKHELGHNTGLGHSSGGVMNPSIVNGLPVSWSGDPSHSTLKRWFGGEPVDIPGGQPEPPDTPDVPDGDKPKIGDPIGDPWELYTGIKVQTFRVFGG